MDFEQLWAPWRMQYIRQEVDPSTEKADRSAEPCPNLLSGGDPDCFVCRAVAQQSDRKNLVVLRTEHTVTILNRYPYNNGHLMVAPKLHLGRLDELAGHVHLECMQTVTRLVGLLEQLLKAEGFNVGLNLGKMAGAGLPGHLHWHIVPRWTGDTNFMPILTGIKVIPQSLDALWEMLNDALGTFDR